MKQHPLPNAKGDSHHLPKIKGGTKKQMKLFMVKMRFLQKLNFIAVILALALVFGFTFVSCDTGTTPEETIPPEENNGHETRIIIISNVSLAGRAGVWLASSLPSGNNSPTNTAIQSGTITNNTIAFSLVVPRDNTWNDGPAWLGSGDYYVYIVPIANSSYLWNNALVYTSDGSTPSRVTFNKAITRLSFDNFKRRSKPEPFSFDGHWNIYNYLGNQQSDVYFGTTGPLEGRQYYILRNDKMFNGGEFIFDDNTFTTRPGSNFESTLYYTVIDNNTIYIDDIKNQANSPLWRETTLKRSGRTGRMLPVDRSWTFVDD
jgi:hypothetical protein